jgi:hypothetical protein
MDKVKLILEILENKIKMKKIISLATFVILFTAVFFSCGKEQSVPDCQKNNYGILEVKNDFTESVELRIDGVLKGILKVGETKKFTLQAGLTYSIYAEEEEYFLLPDDTWSFNINVVQCQTITRRLTP